MRQKGYDQYSFLQDCNQRTAQIAFGKDLHLDNFDVKIGFRLPLPDKRGELLV